MTGEYIMQFRCWNCGGNFTRNIPKGQPARGRGWTCPICGMDEYKGGVLRPFPHEPVGVIDTRTMGEL